MPESHPANPSHRGTSRLVTSLTWLLLCLVTACANPTQQTTPTSNPSLVPSTTPSAFSTRTPTPEPLNSEANPIIFAVVSESNDLKAAAAAEEVVARMRQITAFNIKIRMYTSYPPLLADLQAGKAHIVFLPPFTYLLAKQQGSAQVALMTNHLGVYQYGSQFLANVASKFTLFFDPTKNQNTSDASTALRQLDGKRPCWVDPLSSSGYIQALGLLNEKGIKVKDGAFLQNHTAVVRALYITGICDYGVTFATTGDPRTSTAVSADLTDVLNRVLILWQTEPIIPNLNVSFWKGMSAGMRDDLIFALQDFVKGEKNRANLSTALAYEIQDFKVVNDLFYEPLSLNLKNTKINLETLIGK